MEAILDQVRDVFEGQIDFEGQRLTELISNVMLGFFSIVALLVGFIKQDIYLCLWIGLGGTALTTLAVVPPWPFFNQKPQPWIGSTTELPQGGIVIGGRKIQ